MRREHRLQIRNGALDLNDEQHGLYRVAGEDVDGPALAVNGKGDLSPYLPVPVDQQPCSRLDRRGMRTIEQPVERLTVPTKKEIEGGAQRVGGGRHGSQRQAADLAKFEP